MLAGAFGAGLGGIGLTLSLVGSAFLASTVGDFGFSTEAGRVAAHSGDSATMNRIARRLTAHMAVALLLGPAISVAVAGQHISTGTYVSIALYSAALVAAAAGVTVLYGLGGYGSVTLLLGSCRLAATVLIVVVSAISRSTDSVAPILAGAEVLGAVLMWIGIRRRALGRTPKTQDAGSFAIDNTFGWLGVAAVLNVLTNQSDVLLVARTLSPTDLGIFGLASQLQNAVATFAVAAATTLPSFVSRHSNDTDAILRHVAHCRKTTTALLAAGLGLLLPAIAFSALLGLSPERLSKPTAIVPIVVCLLSAVPSCYAFVNISGAVGLRAHTSVGVSRSLVGLVAVVLIAGGAAVYGLLGACGATLARDLILLATTAVVFRKALVAERRRRPIGPHVRGAS